MFLILSLKQWKNEFGCLTLPLLRKFHQQSLYVYFCPLFSAGLSQLNSATWGQTHTDQSYWYAASLFLKATWMVKCPNWLGLPADLTSKSDSGTCTLLKAGMPPQEVANWNLRPPLWQKITTDHCRQIPSQNCWKPNSEQTREKKKKTQKLKKMFTTLMTSLTYFEIMSNTHVTHCFLTLIVIQRFSFFHQMNSHYLKTLSSMLQSKSEGL